MPTKPTAHVACFIVPHHSVVGTEHFAHLPHFLRELSSHVPLHVIVERGSAPHIPGALSVTVLPQRSRWHRAVGLVHLILRMTRGGPVVFVLRYSRIAATTLVLVRALRPLTVLYWVSGQADRSISGGLRALMIRQVKEWHFRWLVRKVDRLLTGPAAMATYMRQRWRVPLARISVLANDVDTSRFIRLDSGERSAIRTRHGWRDDDIVVLYVHRVSERRGSELLVPFVEAISTRLGSGKIQLAVVGDGPGMGRLRRDRDRSRLADNIHVFGALPNSGLPALYGAADIFLMPSYEEGFPRVILEAMSCGLPIVCTPAGGTREILPDWYPYITDGFGHEGLVDRAARLVANEDLPDLGEQLRRHCVRHYDTTTVAAAYAEIVRDSLAGCGD